VLVPAVLARGCRTGIVGERCGYRADSLRASEFLPTGSRFV